MGLQRASGHCFAHDRDRVEAQMGLRWAFGSFLVGYLDRAEAHLGLQWAFAPVGPSVRRSARHEIQAQ